MKALPWQPTAVFDSLFLSSSCCCLQVSLEAKGARVFRVLPRVGVASRRFTDNVDFAVETGWFILFYFFCEF